MTTRVYIDGDLGKPHQLKIIDADTGADVTDTFTVQDVKVSIGVNQNAMVQVAYYDKTDTHYHSLIRDAYDLVEKPKSPLAGTELHAFKLQREHRPNQASTHVLASQWVYEVQNDGTVKQTSAGPKHVADDVSDADVFGARDGVRVLREKTKAAMGVLMFDLHDKLERALPIMPISNAGGTTKQHVRGFVQEAIKKAVTQLTCDECKGTGFYHGLNSKTPCSKGCRA